MSSEPVDINHSIEANIKTEEIIPEIHKKIKKTTSYGYRRSY